LQLEHNAVNIFLILSLIDNCGMHLAALIACSLLPFVGHGAAFVAHGTVAKSMKDTLKYPLLGGMRHHAFQGAAAVRFRSLTLHEKPLARTADRTKPKASFI
jgi:hypothetical protein